MRPADLPARFEIAFAPELAALSLLDCAAAAAVRALLEAHPDLARTPLVRDWRQAPTHVGLADDIVRHAEALQHAIHDYYEHMTLFVSPPTATESASSRDPRP